MLPKTTLILSLAVAASLMGCGTFRKPGFPHRTHGSQEAIGKLAAHFPVPDLMDDYYENDDEATRRTLRDKIIGGSLALFDLHYSNFVAQFAFTRQTIDTAADVAVLGLDIASTAVGTAGIKTILSAVSTGVGGARMSIDKNFFYEQTVPVLVSAMDAQRKARLVPLLDGQSQPTTAYGLERALSDLEAYYHAGTFVGALNAIQKDAAEKEEKEILLINEMRGPDFFERKRQERVSGLLDAIDGLSDAKAVELASNPAVANAAVDPLIAARKLQANDPAQAKQILRIRAIYAKRTDEQLEAWETALKAAE